MGTAWILMRRFKLPRHDGSNAALLALAGLLRKRNSSVIRTLSFMAGLVKRQSLSRNNYSQQTGEIMAARNFKSNLIIGLVSGLGASLLAPALRPFLANVSRSLAKGTIKGSVLLYEK